MLRVPVQKIQPGMYLARPIPMPNDPYRFLLQRDREIPLDLIPRLQQLGILEVWVRHRGLEFLEDIIDEDLGEHQREIYIGVRQNFESLMRDVTARMEFSQFQTSISSFFSYLKQSSGSNILLQKLDAFDDYLMSHSANISYLALLVGMNLDRYLIDERRCKTAREAKELHFLGLGCLLHDVGKIKVPKEILNKPGRLTADEMDEMRRHTTYGYELVKGRIPATASQIVLNHHQRWDGKGYPARIDSVSGDEFSPLSDRQIPIFSRIATMADIYDAATSKRCYSGAKLPVRVLHEMRTYCRGFFDPVVEKAFYSTVPPFPIGQVVELSDKSSAAVVDFNSEFPVSPKVQCLRRPNGEAVKNPAFEEIDLSLHPDLEIVAVEGQDVREWTVSQITLESVDALV